MIVIYTTNGCSSCRKAKAYFNEHNIEYKEKNIFKAPLKDAEIKYLLTRSELGVDDIVSKRSKVILDSNINIDDLTIDELCTFIKNNPSCMKRPIIINEKNMQVGFDRDDIDSFLPKLRHQFKCDPSCKKYYECNSK